MRIIITGSPGVGKTAVAKMLGRRINHRVVNEQQFALEKRLGKWASEENELVIPLGPFAKELNLLLAKEKKVIVEGHLLCELKLKADAVVLIRMHPELLEARLQAKGYSAEKVQDNVFCEGIDYCKKHVARNYAKKKLIEVQSRKTIKETMQHIINCLCLQGAKL